MPDFNNASNKIAVKPKIGITGSLGRGNYGDELYVKAYQYWFGGWADLFLLTGLSRPKYFSEIKGNVTNLMDAIVMGGGDLLCPYREHIDPDFINPDYLKRPFHVAGIGVERNREDIDPKVLKRWSSFLKHPSVASISMRDSGSKKWIEEHINPNVPVTSHPDWVCALPLPKVEENEDKPILGLVTRHIKEGKHYRLMEEAARILKNKGWRVVHIIGGVGPHGKKDYENSKLLKVDGKETMYSEDLDEISKALGKCSLVLSMKLHTTIVSTMYRVPTICVNPVAKAKAYMGALGLEKFALAAHDKRILEYIEEGVPQPSADAVEKLRREASVAFVQLGQQIWSDFREHSLVKELIPTEPDFPEIK